MFFFIGCGGGGGGELAPETPTDEESMTILNKTTRKVTVKAGDESIELQKDKCVAVTQTQFNNGLEILAHHKGKDMDVSLCGSKEPGSITCLFQHVFVTLDATRQFTLDSLLQEGCNQVLGGEKEESGEEGTEEEESGEEGTEEEESGGEGTTPVAPETTP